MTFNREVGFCPEFQNGNVCASSTERDIHEGQHLGTKTNVSKATSVNPDVTELHL
jgi:hypothetical protein